MTERTDDERRREVLQRLEAARSHLETANLYAVAQELVVQGLDIVGRSEREQLFHAAMAEIDDDARVT